ncbi:MAG: flavodoxin-dependent (E)-4-hydroxy-3-methylbut-2-enyl-diphosphate synthase [Oscillospiraceae bacterium]|jgi:(E)-4-hydroxy-3-methylbut-2-enyl-diphosphate synthase|nr:flavodoxin-dependent (E)-4-hydroxy-3-methylbut-2-enyl-diphosphate synthase [Oscillospiraceae bacterium]
MGKATRPVFVGGVQIGGGAPVTVQSMTNTDTRDVAATLAQIRALADVGADIVRVSVYDMACAQAVRALAAQSPVPLVADIHFDHRLAVAAVENGVHKLRINPGNIGGAAHVRLLADCLKAHRVPARVGVNGGSLEKDLLAKYGGPTPQAMVESALAHARLLENCGFSDIVLSMKASNVPDTVDAYRLAAAQCDYPLHLGVTEAGLPEQGTVKSAVGIGALLLDGIGDTLRVSLTGDPVAEPPVGLDILRAAGLRNDRLTIVACPTCGRARIDVAGIARRVQQEVGHLPLPLTVAVMGCVVNGPGEAREADMGIAGGDGAGALFVKGEPPRKVTGDLADALIALVRARAAGL